MIIRFHPDAEGELKDTISWYEHQRAGLGLEFAACIDNGLENIKYNPKMFPTIQKTIRRVTIRKFPFAIFYEIEDNEIQILAVFHSSRNPKKWIRRK